MKEPLDRVAILAAGATGLVPGSLAVLQLYGPAVEVALWTLLAALVWAPIVHRRASPRPFASLVLVGLVAGVLTGLVQGALAHVILERNATMAAQAPDGATLAFRAYTFAFAVVAGTVWGALAGAAREGVVRLRARRAPA